MEHLYFHIPWCKRKCGYCSFYSKVEFDFERYFFLAQQNLKKISKFAPFTVYFGGGTPSLLKIQQLQKLLHLVDLSRCTEMTIEVNPSDVSKEYALGLKKLGFDRISLGVQSFLDKELKLLGRRADSRQTQAAYQWLRSAGFGNISCDLIYGLPKQDLSDLRFSLHRLLELRPEHISTYLLTLEQGVSMYSQRESLPSEYSVARFYRVVRQTLLSADYQQYELSNFSLDGYASQHNLAYWCGKEYLAIGEGGCSYYAQGQRYFRTDGFGGKEELSPQQREFEFIFLGLRLIRGVLLAEYRHRFGKDFVQKYERVLQKYRQYLLIDQTRVALHPRAYFVADEVMAEFANL